MHVRKDMRRDRCFDAKIDLRMDLFMTDLLRGFCWAYLART